MKKSILSMICMLIIFGYTAKAQIVVFSQNKCKSATEAIEFAKEELGPFLNAQVDAGNLVNWGILSHNWGDEWNVNIYYGAESLDKFQTAFNEAINGFLEKNPDGMTQFEELCFEHKDNIYGRAYSYPATEEDN